MTKNELIHDNRILFIIIYLLAPIQVQIYEGYFTYGLFSWGRITLNPTLYKIKPFFMLNPEKIGYFHPWLGLPLYIFTVIMNINLIVNLLSILAEYKFKFKKLIEILKIVIIIIDLASLMMVPVGYILTAYLIGYSPQVILTIAITVTIPPFNFTTPGLLYKISQQVLPLQRTIKKEKVDIFQQIKINPKLNLKYIKLIEIYKTKYSHNPEGVLKYHINREFEKECNIETVLDKLLEKYESKV